ncbi:MAG: hypothetical protein K2I18_08520 [Paramuribaculum sp.]|nr:hypothetical protein [Paramuribaculum sp.]
MLTPEEIAEQGRAERGYVSGTGGDGGVKVLTPEELATKGRELADIESGKTRFNQQPFVEETVQIDTSVPEKTMAGVSEQNAAEVDSSSLTPEEIIEATAGDDAKIKAYREFLAGLEPPETKEQREKRERRERRRRRIAAIGDGLTALSNLYFTTQYAPDMYRPGNGQLEKVSALQEKLRQQREAQRAAYFRLAMGLGDAESGRARTLREMKAQKEARELAKEKAKRDAMLAPVIYDTRVAELDDAKNKATISGERAKVAPQVAQNEVEAGEALIGQRKASARASHAQAGASAARSKYYGRQGFVGSLPDDSGKMVDYYSKADYEARIAQLVKQHGVHTHQVVKTETTQYDRNGRKKGSSSKAEPRKKAAAELAGEVISKSQEKKGKGYGDDAPADNEKTQNKGY